MNLRPMLAVISARAASKGLPGKNVQLLSGLPLIAHSLHFASLIPQIDRCVVSTESEKIAEIARSHGGDIPFIRPPDLATDNASMWDVLHHALHEMERIDAHQYSSLVLLDPTSPFRLPSDFEKAFSALENDENAAGVVSVSKPTFNPRWVCVEEKNNYMVRLFPEYRDCQRRQDVPDTYRINGVLYIWKRTQFLNKSKSLWSPGPYLMIDTPETRGFSIDTPQNLLVAELFLKSGLVKLPWLQSKGEDRS